MTTPQRIQLRRTEGWRKPADAINVARPTKWGNPCRIVGRYFVRDENGYEHYAESAAETRGIAARLFREALMEDRLSFTIDDVEDELAGHDLACWCPLVDEHGNRVPCHADVLLELANQEATP
ncbi:DUF4326 domain-containing protein [Mycobacterium sp.]|uniref:DUF4326 domain-containing protein n=1 Tax=Mycobacterium sp. TaxID=1785 RepID=UPI0025FBD54B|nr:DUF4326 domain-containing protein [Mycobacterium sp.]